MQVIQGQIEILFDTSLHRSPSDVRLSSDAQGVILVNHVSHTKRELNTSTKVSPALDEGVGFGQGCHR